MDVGLNELCTIIAVCLKPAVIEMVYYLVGTALQKYVITCEIALFSSDLAYVNACQWKFCEVC